MDNFDDHLALPEPLISILPPQDLLSKIYQQLGEATTGEVMLDHSWMRLGGLLLQYKNSNQWKADGFSSFETFMGTLKEKYQRGKTQLWGYVSVAEHLLPTIDSTTLEKIGISKALEMRRQSKLAGKPVPEEIVKAAAEQSTTIKELRAMLGAAFNTQDDGQKGTWFDFQGTYYTPEEKKEFKEAVVLTLKVLGIKPNVPEHIQRKEIFRAWAQEFVGTHSAEVYGQQQAPGPAPDMPERYVRLGEHADDCAACAAFITNPSPCTTGYDILAGKEDDDEKVWVEVIPPSRTPCTIFRSHKQAIESGAAIMEWARPSAVEIIRRKVFERDNYTCTNCNDNTLTWGNAHMHERLWRGNGGLISIHNSVTLCYNCHQHDENAGHGKRQPQWSKDSAAM